MGSFLDPRFPAQNMNHIYLRSGGTFHFDLEEQKKRTAEEINHCKEFYGTTLFVEFGPSIHFADIVSHFTKFGDVEVSCFYFSKDTLFLYIFNHIFEYFR